MVCPVLRRLLGAVCYLGVMVVVVSLLAEAVLRILLPHSASLRSLAYDPQYAGDYASMTSLEKLLASTQLGYRPFQVVSGFRLNSRSFRDEEYTREKAQGVFRAVVLGDSFAFACGGVPHRQLWPQVVETALSLATGRSVELISLGVAGIGPRFELRMWQLEGSSLSPDLVILAFCVGNDFGDGMGIATEPGVSSALAHRAVLYRCLRNLHRLIQSGALPSSPPHSVPSTITEPQPQTGGYAVEGYTYDDLRPTFSRAEYVKLMSRRMGQCRDVNREHMLKLARGIEQILAELRREVTNAGAELLVMVIPDEFQVDPALAKEAAALRATELSEYDIEWPQRTLREICDRQGIRCLDLLPDFRREACTHRLYRLQNTHWNIEGNALAARILVRELAPDLGSR